MPDPSLTHTIDTHPLRLHEGAVVGDEEIDRLKADHRETKRFLNRELDQRDDEIASLRAELAKRDETIAELEAKAAGTEELLEVAEEGRDKATAELALVRDVNAKLDAENTNLAELIASLRTQLTRAKAIEEAAQGVINDLVDWKLGDRLEAALIDGGVLIELAAVLAIASPFPSPSATPEWEPKCPWSPEGITALRAAGGSDWDKIADVRAFLGRDEDEKLSRLLESVLAAIEEYNSNFAHMTYKDDAMKAMVKAYADYVAPEAHL